jgi:hypothetical protein
MQVWNPLYTGLLAVRHLNHFCVISNAVWLDITGPGPFERSDTRPAPSSADDAFLRPQIPAPSIPTAGLAPRGSESEGLLKIALVLKPKGPLN